MGLNLHPQRKEDNILMENSSLILRFLIYLLSQRPKELTMYKLQDYYKGPGYIVTITNV